MNYEPNSHKSKMEKRDISEKKVEKVITGTAKSKKKSELRKFTDVFLAEDMESVKSYILTDVLVPSIKKAIDDIVSNGIHMLLYNGESRHHDSKGVAGKVSYRSYYDKGDNRRDYHARSRNMYTYDDIYLETRGEAEQVLDRMDELVKEYGIVSVADLNELVGITGAYTDNKYGWTDIRSASIVRTRDGYMIKMPRALPLD